MISENTAIKVEHVTKLYRLGTKEELHDNLVSSFINFLKSPLRNFRYYKSLYTFKDLDLSNREALENLSPDVICAVKDVSFTVKKGEVLGIIGSNGAGKSTLMKILSRITHPTQGRIIAKGKISSLLEVGTGFHPDLTGRENIYLNGTILGMRKKEIDFKFDKIVNFSGVEKFLDTPVKRYSSGMKVRLAFSVAAHLDPEILVIDEVLAVGDAEFQKKCLGRMSQVARGGKTVLFVSHDMRAVSKLCTRVLLLEAGSVTQSGNPVEIIERYLSSKTAPSFTWTAHESEKNNRAVQFLNASILSSNSKPIDTVNYNSGFNVSINYEVKQILRNCIINLRLSDQMGNDIFVSWDTDLSKEYTQTRYPGTYTSVCKIPPFLIKPGRYKIKIGAMIPGRKLFERIEDVFTIDITPIGYPLNKERKGIIAPLLEWEIRNGRIKDD